MKIKHTESVKQFIKSYLQIQTKDGEVFYYIPYWFEMQDDGSFIGHRLDKLPKKLTKFIKDSGEFHKILFSKEDLISLVKGTSPNYNVMNNPIVRDYGRYSEQNGWRWDDMKLDECSKEFLYSLYQLCKNSWNKS